MVLSNAMNGWYLKSLLLSNVVKGWHLGLLLSRNVVKDDILGCGAKQCHWLTSQVVALEQCREGWHLGLWCHSLPWNIDISSRCSFLTSLSSNVKKDDFFGYGAKQCQWLTLTILKARSTLMDSIQQIHGDLDYPQDSIHSHGFNLTNSWGPWLSSRLDSLLWIQFNQFMGVIFNSSLGFIVNKSFSVHFKNKKLDSW